MQGKNSCRRTSDVKAQPSLLTSINHTLRIKIVFHAATAPVHRSECAALVTQVPTTIFHAANRTLGLYIALIRASTVTTTFHEEGLL
jgi:hypothetical protein